MEYNPIPNVKKAKSIVITLFAIALVIFMIPSVPFIPVPPALFQTISFVLITFAILLLVRYVFTTFTYQLKDQADTMSPYPKLNIYRIRGKRSNMAYCIPFNNIISIEKSEKTRAKGEKSENLCPSINPSEIYKIKYLCDELPENVYIECNDVFAKEIELRIQMWSDVTLE